MTKYLPKILFIALSVFFLVYLSLPEPKFPTTLWDFRVSDEPSDRETPLRRGYYTNLTREQLMDHYTKEFKWGIKLNYPPEDAQTLVRDQTKSSFLEEIVHPMRESLFVNGYTPASNVPIFEENGLSYKQKVVIKYVSSNVFYRLFVGIVTIGALWLLISEWLKAIKTLKWTSL